MPDPVSSKLKKGCSICGVLSTVGWGVIATGVAERAASRALVTSWAYKFKCKAHKSSRHEPYSFAKVPISEESPSSRADKNGWGTEQQRQRLVCTGGIEDDRMGADGSYGRLLGDCVPGLGASDGAAGGCNVGEFMVVPSTGVLSKPCGAKPFVLAGCGGAAENLLREGVWPGVKAGPACGGIPISSSGRST